MIQIRGTPRTFFFWGSNVGQRTPTWTQLNMGPKPKMVLQVTTPARHVRVTAGEGEAYTRFTLHPKEGYTRFQAVQYWDGEVHERPKGARARRYTQNWDPNTTSAPRHPPKEPGMNPAVCWNSVDVYVNKWLQVCNRFLCFCTINNMETCRPEAGRRNNEMIHY